MDNRYFTILFFALVAILVIAAGLWVYLHISATTAPEKFLSFFVLLFLFWGACALVIAYYAFRFITEIEKGKKEFGEGEL